MRYRVLYFCLMVTVASAQHPIVLDPIPARVLGHPAITPSEQLNVYTINPNLGAGAGLYGPQGIAVDTRSATPTVYVADTGNNRVLAFQNVTSHNPPAQPPMVIGQPNSYTTLPAISGGLNGPTGLLVDSSGALYVADTANNRVLRYPKPLTPNPAPDLVLGQPDPFTSNRPNQGTGLPSATSLSLSGYIATALAMDSTGLYVADPGNRRVMHYATGSLKAGANGPAADTVIGQSSFTSLDPVTGILDRSHIYEPAGLAFDSAGHLFITDYAADRMLVFSAPFATAIRLAGIVLTGPSGTSASNFHAPQGIVMINNGPVVMDGGYNRILVFDPYSSTDWALASGDTTFATPPPIAIAALGQGTSLTNFTATEPNMGESHPSASTVVTPTAGALVGTDLYVADTGNNRILIFPMAGQAATATQVLGQGPFPYNSASDFLYGTLNGIQGEEFFFGPNSVPLVLGGALQNFQLTDAGIAVDAASDPPHLYVSDPNNHRVLGFADARKAGPGVLADLVLGQIDRGTAICNYNGVPNSVSLQPLQPPLQPTQSSLCYPTGLAVDSGGNLYVADSRNGRVMKFPAPFAAANCAKTPCYNEPASAVLGQAAFTGLKNPTPSQFVMSFPYGVAYDSSAGLLVSDLSANRVLLIAKANLTTGAGAAQVFGQSDFTSESNTILNQPHHIAVDSSGNLYVADSGHNQIQIFNIPSGSSQAVNALTQLSYPQAVWVNPNNVAGYRNDIWVGDGNGLSRYPVPSPLGGNNPTLQIAAATLKAGKSTLCSGQNDCGVPPLAITQDGAGNLYVADYSNRVAIHYQALAATNGASFACGGGCNLGTLNDPQSYLAPGALASLFPLSVLFPVTPTSAPAGVFPIPSKLADVQVTVNGQAAPLFFVEPGQINLVLPSGAPTAGTAQVLVTQASTSQVLASGTLVMNAASLGFFTNNAQGTGQIAALNQDNTRNSTTNPAKLNSVIQLFGTGQGLVPGAPADGQPAPDMATPVPNPTTAYIGGSSATVAYSGLAPGFVGLWQVNIQIPQAPIALPGFPVNVFPVLVVYDGLNSNTPQNNSNPALAATVAIKAQ